MSNKKAQGFPFGLTIIAIVLGWTIFKQFDFESLTFEKPALAIVYIATFLIAVFMIVNGLRSKK